MQDLRGPRKLRLGLGLGLVMVGHPSRSEAAYRSGRVQGIAPLHPPTPPDVPFSVSGGWSHPRLFRASYRAFLSGFRRR